MTVTELKRASDEDLQRIADGMLRKHGIPESYESIAAELLTYHEAIAPQMAEVDACIVVPDPITRGVTTTYGSMRYDGQRLAEIAHSAILACEREKQRAVEAEGKLMACEVAVRNIKATFDAVDAKLLAVLDHQSPRR